MSTAQVHADRINGAASLTEQMARVIGASFYAKAVEYEDLNDTLGQTAECLTRMEFADGSTLVRHGDTHTWGACHDKLSTA